jgi:hypothetical protein
MKAHHRLTLELLFVVGHICQAAGLACLACWRCANDAADRVIKRAQQEITK